MEKKKPSLKASGPKGHEPKMPESKGSGAFLACPDCGRNANLSQSVLDIPNFGQALFSVVSCPFCNFRLSDVFPVSFNEPAMFSAKISSSAGLSTKIVKSSSATVRIPELGITIEPGPASEGYYSNIEGLLERIEFAAMVLVNSLDGKGRKNAENAVQKIVDARSAKNPFTVEVLDPFGNSALVGKNVAKRMLSKKELARLKKPIAILGRQ